MAFHFLGFYSVAENESDDADVHRFNAYFTDPYNNSRKAECESNHRLCRYGQGKRESIDDSSDQEIIDLFSMINSHPRNFLGWLSPFQAFRKAFPDSAGLIAALGYREVHADQAKFKKEVTPISNPPDGGKRFVSFANSAGVPSFRSPQKSSETQLPPRLSYPGRHG